MGFFIWRNIVDKYKLYEQKKAYLQSLNLDAEEYERLIKNLAESLGI